MPTSPRPSRVVETVELIRAVAAASLADAFAVWSQTMVVEYLLCCPPGPGSRDEVDGLRAAQITGATGMAPAVADLAGQAPLPLLADAAVDSAGTALNGPGQVLAAEHAVLCGRRDVVADRLMASAGGSGATAPAAPRLDALRLVADAVHLDGVLHGGRGFHAGSTTARRRREAAFLPVQAPTEVQLRTMLAAAADGDG